MKALLLLLCLPLLGMAQPNQAPKNRRDSILYYVLKGEWVKLPQELNQSNREVLAAYPKLVIVRGDTLDRQDWNCDTSMPLYGPGPDREPPQVVRLRSAGTMHISCPAIRYVRRDEQPVSIKYGDWRRVNQRLTDLENRKHR